MVGKRGNEGWEREERERGRRGKKEREERGREERGGKRGKRGRERREREERGEKEREERERERENEKEMKKEEGREGERKREEMKEGGKRERWKKERERNEKERKKEEGREGGRERGERERERKKDREKRKREGVTERQEYLAKNKVVHRDLATRNILLSSPSLVKISDFGLSEDVYEQNVFQTREASERLPIKWLALESLLHNVYTTKSDVWSFGVVLWELVTMGANPYPHIPLCHIPNVLKKGYRMERPASCSPEM
ncbi:hypothetical protein WDU94_002734 [Cyamophila willieti]